METDPELADYVLRLGDDALVTSQRLCEWCAQAPFLEEDIALANIGLDYLGRARLLLQYAGELLGRSEDDLAYQRDGHEFRNLLMVELPRGDFAFTMVRQYLLDEYERSYFTDLQHSSDERLAAIAGKAVKEVSYHHRRSAEWMRRLGLGTDESNARSQVALNELWAFVAEFFVMDDVEKSLVVRGVAVDRVTLKSTWSAGVEALLSEANLTVPEYDPYQTGGRQGVHTEYLGHLLTEMQTLQRRYPGLEW